MDPVNLAVAENIRNLREERKLSMEALSKLSGVSKSMLAQIERGDGNPTLSSLWKIANGINVPFDALTARPKPSYEIIKISEIQPILEDNGKVRNFSVFPDDENRRFSVYYLELEPRSYWKSEPHLSGVIEFITIIDGSIEINMKDRIFAISKGESIRFRGDTEHSYRNTYQSVTTFHMILYNP